MKPSEVAAREFFGCEEEHATRCCEFGGEDGSGCETLAKELDRFADEAVREERERCAKVAEDFELVDCGDYYHNHCGCEREALEKIAAALRSAPDEGEDSAAGKGR